MFSCNSIYSRYSAIFAIAILYLFVAAPIASAQSTSQQETWYPVTDLPMKLADRNAIIQGNSIYIVGGQNSDGKPIPDVYRAEIGPGVMLTNGWGKLGDLKVERDSHAVVAINNFLYTIGGHNAQIVSNTVYQAQFLAGNNLTPWNNINQLPIRVYVHDAVILNGILYIVGGVGGVKTETDHPLRSVYYAAMKSDGTLDRSTATAELPRTLFRHTLVGYNSWLYLIGGYDDHNARAEVYRAQVKTNGGLDSWIKLADLPQPRYYTEALIRNNELIVLGGTDGSTVFADVLSATINPNDGTLGAWKSSAPLPEPCYRFGATLGSLGQIYITGGLSLDASSNKVYHNEVYVLAKPPHITCQLYNEPIGQVAPGAVISYTSTCQVGATFAADGVSLSAPIPEGVNFVDAQTGGQFDSSSNTVRWVLNTLNPSTITSLSYRVKYPDTAEPNQLITNAGTTIDWQAVDGSHQAQSNVVLNNGYLLFLPNIFD